MAYGIVGGGGVLTKAKRVFYRAGTAYEGYAVCWNFDALDIAAEGETITAASATDWCDARRVQVEDPSFENNVHFAGVIDGASAGVVGPNWILIHEPGSICKVHTAITVDHRDATATSVNSYQMLTFGVCTNSVGAAHTTAPYINGQWQKYGLPGEGSAIVLEAATTASALVMAELLTGPQSGGRQYLPILATAIYGITVTYQGVTFISAETNATTVGSCAIGAGTFIGQRKIIEVDGALSGVGIQVSFANGNTVNLSGEYLIAAPLVGVTAVTLISGGFLDMYWNGTKWIALANAKIT
mgnify:FL=1